MALSLYIHYPFCVRKCRYCDFLSGPADDAARQTYLKALAEEMAHSGMEGAEVDTVFFGGGTPSLILPEEMEMLLHVMRQHFCIRPDAEMTIECNPGTADPEKLTAYRRLGINRISIGVQSFHDDELQLLGRIHTAAEARLCVAEARQAGFDNLSLDLMSALPGQTFEQWSDNLRQAAALKPEHISAYSLILEDNTPLKTAYEAGTLPPVPEDEEDRRMYHYTKSFLESCGYHRYEISNYARDGYECRHNLGYWSGHEYLGLGLGASSLVGNVRFRNTRNMKHYLQILTGHNDTSHPDSGTSPDDALLRKVMTSEYPLGLREEPEELTLRDQMGEFMWLGLRKTEGVSETRFRQRFGQNLMDVFGDIIEGHIRRGLLKRKDGMIFLTEYGTDISNYVMCDFV